MPGIIGGFVGALIGALVGGLIDKKGYEKTIYHCNNVVTTSNLNMFLNMNLIQ